MSQTQLPIHISITNDFLFHFIHFSKLNKLRQKGDKKKEEKEKRKRKSGIKGKDKRKG